MAGFVFLSDVVGFWVKHKKSICSKANLVVGGQKTNYFPKCLLHSHFYPYLCA